jgi:anti-sigma regulatory factor (Ser/Thr protein kinase)
MWRELPEARARLGSRRASERVNSHVHGSSVTGELVGRDRTQVLGLPHDPSAPRTARAWLGREFGTELGDGTLATAKLLVSEIVTNAVRHGEGDIVLRARLDPGRLFAEVIDEGHGFTWTVPERDRERSTGWGLMLVAGEADRWGVDGVTTHVWFELIA